MNELNREPLFLVSLSGGGYRAALINAGVIRAIYSMGKLNYLQNDNITFVNCVSGSSNPVRYGMRSP